MPWLVCPGFGKTALHCGLLFARVTAGDAASGRRLGLESWCVLVAALRFHHVSVTHKHSVKPTQARR